MHKGSKERRQEKREILDKRLRPPKDLKKSAREFFKRPPYQYTNMQINTARTEGIQ